MMSIIFWIYLSTLPLAFLLLFFFLVFCRPLSLLFSYFFPNSIMRVHTLISQTSVRVRVRVASAHQRSGQAIATPSKPRVTWHRNNGLTHTLVRLAALSHPPLLLLLLLKSNDHHSHFIVNLIINLIIIIIILLIAIEPP